MLRITHNGKSRLHWNKVVDSGNRTAFGTGSQRDTQEGKGRYDLIPTSVLHRLAVHYENGAAKYGDNNWQKGQSLAQYYNSAMRHLNAIRDADLSEDHFAAALWNVAAMIHHIDAMLDGTLPQELDSFGIVDKIQQIERTEALKEYQTPFMDKPLKVVMSGAYGGEIPLPTYLQPDNVKAFDKDRFPDNRPGYREVTNRKYNPEEY